MQNLPTNYIELNWLAKKDKDISLPSIIFDDIDYGGCYYSPMHYEILIGEKFYPLDNGLIVINSMYSDNFIENSIVHEWRHHWQVMNGYELNIISWNTKSKMTYKQQIIEYFTKSSSELDALIYSNKISPCDDTIEWYEWILKQKKRLN